MMLFLLSTGCVSGEFAAYLPSVQFKRLQLTAIDFEKIDVDFVFDVQNPNPVGFPLERFNYGLALEGHEFLSGETVGDLALAPEATSEVNLPVSLDFEEMFATIEATKGLDYVGFGLNGRFGWDTDFGPVDIHFDEEGSFPALRVPKFTLDELVVTEFDDEKVRFGLDFGVENEQGSALGFQNFDYKVKLAGVKVASGKEDDVGEAAGAQRSTLRLPFEVNYEDAYDAYEAWESGEKLDVDLAAAMEVETPFGPVPLSIDENGNIRVGDDG